MKASSFKASARTGDGVARLRPDLFDKVEDLPANLLVVAVCQFEEHRDGGPASAPPRADASPQRSAPYVIILLIP